MQETLNTKLIMAQALKHLTKSKSFEKITISDITQESGYNRQTFYYHFRDKFELLSWIYEYDAHQVFDAHLSFENWHNYMTAFLYDMRKDKIFYMNTIHSDDRYFQSYIFNLTKSIFYIAIEHLDSHRQLREEDKNFYAEFFSFGVSGILVNWAKHDMKEAPEKVATNLKNLAQDSEHLAYECYRNVLTKKEAE